MSAASRRHQMSQSELYKSLHLASSVLSVSTFTTRPQNPAVFQKKSVLSPQNTQKTPTAQEKSNVSEELRIKIISDGVEIQYSEVTIY